MQGLLNTANPLPKRRRIAIHTRTQTHIHTHMSSPSLTRSLYLSSTCLRFSLSLSGLPPLPRVLEPKIAFIPPGRPVPTKRHAHNPRARWRVPITTNRAADTYALNRSAAVYNPILPITLRLQDERRQQRQAHVSTMTTPSEATAYWSTSARD